MHQQLAAGTGSVTVLHDPSSARALVLPVAAHAVAGRATGACINVA